MCPFIKPQEEERFVETIRIEHGRIYNLSFHNARMNQTRKILLDAKNDLDLSTCIQPSSYMKRTKCRVEYAADFIKVEYADYNMRPVHSLRLVSMDDIEYRYKSTNRQCLADAFAMREDKDDVLIVRRGLVTDTSICNVAFWNGHHWITPLHPLLKGTKRAFLLEKGIIQAADIRLEDLRAYSCVRMFNALIDFGEQECSL